MLYSTTIKFNDKEYMLKVGVRELLKFEEVGIDLASGQMKFSDLIKAFHIALSRNPEVTEALVMDIMDDSDYSMEELVEKLKTAMELGINKGKTKNV